jgi:sucrose phosphorylase
MRTVFDAAAPEVMIITETNVPHKENISYFGDGYDEAQRVYQFSLPPLTAHALLTGNSTYLTQWADSLDFSSKETTYFNFTASHDGVGVRPAEGLIPEEERLALGGIAKKHGGYVSSKTNEDGSESPYELNINYRSFLACPGEKPEVSADRFLCSQGIMLSMPGVPGIYIHSIIGSENFNKGVEQTGMFRSINREKLSYEQLKKELSEESRAYVFKKYKKLIQLRITEPCFDPYGSAEVIDLGSQFFCIKRYAREGNGELLALFNITDKTQECVLPVKEKCADIITGKKTASGVSVKPYGMMWIKLR